MTSLDSEKERIRFDAFQLHRQGKKNLFIAGKFKKSVRWVQRNNKRFKETGAFKDRRRSRGARKVTPRDVKRLLKTVKGKRRQSVRKTASSFKTAKGEKLSRESIRKSLRLAGLYPHRRRKVTFLTDAQKAKRVRFAKKYRRFDWTEGVYWDETEFELHSTPNLKNDITWDERGAAFNYEKQAHPQKFKFGAAITVNGPTRLVPYTGTIDSLKYVQMVTQVLPDIKKLMKGVDWVFIHDGARPHTSKLTTSMLTPKLQRLFPKGDWPPNSPDDNPAENAFGYLEDEIGPMACKTLPELERKVRKAWAELTPEFCRKCIEAIPKRLQEMIRTKGEYVYKKK